MTGSGQTRTFGKRKENHLLILACGDKVRHMTIRPWMAAATISFFGLFTIVYLTATAYLVVRDDLIGASMARQARMQHDYEDRISALRAQVDRITSRQLLDQQVVEEKVEKLLERQTALASRQGKLGTVLERAENFGINPASDTATVTQSETLDDQHTNAGELEPFKLLLGEQRADLGGLKKTRSLALAYADDNMADRADMLFSKVTHSLKSIEKEQLTHIQNLTADAAERTENIQRILANTGVKIPEKLAAAETVADSAIGGPYVAPETAAEFESSISELDLALDQFEKVKTFAQKLPFNNPAPGRQITSLFGNRIDPFLGKLAMHAGIDFRQKTGSDVRASGAGVVINAGPFGGYGNMVEIDHGNGITTRFGHLSEILVNKGDVIREGEIIALSGSTGRSTGPHLHYEVRRNGHAVDPMRFLNAGLKLSTYIE